MCITFCEEDERCVVLPCYGSGALVSEDKRRREWKERRREMVSYELLSLFQIYRTYKLTSQSSPNNFSCYYSLSRLRDACHVLYCKAVLYNYLIGWSPIQQWSPLYTTVPASQCLIAQLATQPVCLLPQTIRTRSNYIGLFSCSHGAHTARNRMLDSPQLKRKSTR